MAQKRKTGVTENAQMESGDPSLALLADLLALQLIKNEPKNEKLRLLSAAGYSGPKIASFLGISSNAVAVALHRLRKNNAVD